MGPRLKTETFVLWLGWRLSCPCHCHLSRCDLTLWLWSNHMAGKWSPGSPSLRNLLRSRSFPKMNEKKKVTYLLRMWHIFIPMCGSVSFKWLWRSPTVTQREVFFISLYLYIFFFYLLNILCVGVFVCVIPHVCGRTYTCVTHKFGGQRTSLGIISQILSIFLSFLGRVSHWPGPGKVS